MSFNKTKTDSSLGVRVNMYLTEKGVQTPFNDNSDYFTPPSKLTPSQKIDIIENNIEKTMLCLGLDLEDDSLKDTPKRVAKMYVNEIFWGLDPEKFPKCTAVDNKMKYDEMVTVDNINVMSNCEHHLVVIDGIAQVSYIPNEKVLGLSKINRIVEYFSKRPQIQERLTEQIFYALEYILETSNIAVKINARHYCVISRGVGDTNSTTTTTKLGGVFKTKPEVRAEFLNMSKS